MLGERDGGIDGEKETLAVAGAIDADLLLLQVLLVKVGAACFGDVGSNDADGEVVLVAAAGGLLYLFGGAVAVEDGMAVETDEAIPVLKRRLGAADEEDRVRQRGGYVGMADGVDVGDGVFGVVPAELADAPAISADGVDSDLSGVGENGRGQRGALTGGEQDGEVLIEELNVGVLFGVDVEGVDELLVAGWGVPLMQGSDGDVAA